MKHAVRFLFLMLLSVAGAPGAHAVTLSSLFGGDSLTVGDTLFSDWTLDSYVASDGRSFNPDHIDVTGLPDDGTKGNGVRFVANNNELAVTGDGIYSFLDLQFSFKVSALAPGSDLGNTSLSLPHGLLSYGSIDSIDLGIYIRETVGSTFGASNLGINEVEFSVLNGAILSRLTDASYFLPQKEVWVTKNLLVWATDVTETATLYGFDQRFAQTAAPVPEPATLTLLGLGAAGIAALRRRNKS